MAQYEARPRSKKSIEDITWNIRNACGLEATLEFPVMEFIETVLPEIDDTFNYEYVKSKDLPYGTYAYYDPVCNTMTIREDVYEFACNNDGRHRFTMAHEIGHYFLHREVCLSRKTGNIEAFRDPEWQANTFASSLLMPCKLIQNMPVEEVSQKCGTSYQAAEIAHRNAKKAKLAT